MFGDAGEVVGDYKCLRLEGGPVGRLVSGWLCCKSRVRTMVGEGRFG